MIAALLFLLAASAPSGVYFEQTTVVRSKDAEPAPGVRTRVWCSGRRLRLEAADAPNGPALVLRLDEGRALRLDPEAQLATELDAERLRDRSQADAAVAAGLMGGPAEDDLRTVALDRSRTIAGHACHGFKISGRSVQVEAWVADDLPVRADLFASFLEWSGAQQSLAGLVSAFRALPGFPLETRVRVSVLGEVQETVSTVTSIKLVTPPAERFEVPAGWRTVKEKSDSREVPR